MFFTEYFQTKRYRKPKGQPIIDQLETRVTLDTTCRTKTNTEN